MIKFSFFETTLDDGRTVLVNPHNVTCIMRDNTTNHHTTICFDDGEITITEGYDDIKKLLISMEKKK